MTLGSLRGPMPRPTDCGKGWSLPAVGAACPGYIRRKEGEQLAPTAVDPAMVQWREGYPSRLLPHAVAAAGPADHATENGGGAPPPHGGIGWGEGYHNHPLPTPGAVPPGSPREQHAPLSRGSGGGRAPARGGGHPAGDHSLKKRGTPTPHLRERHNFPLPQAGEKGAQQAAGPRGDRLHPKVDSGGFSSRGEGGPPHPRVLCWRTRAR